MQHLGTHRSRAAVYKLAIGALISGTGTNMAGVALSFRIYTETRSAAWLAVTLLFTLGLTGLFSPVAGYIADRFDRKRLMMTVSALTTLCWAVMPFVDARIALILLAAAATVIDMPYDLAAGAAIPNLVDEQDVNWANSRFGAAYNAGKLAGPALGGILYAVSGTTLVFVINAVTFAVAGLLVATIRQPFSSSTETSDGDEAGSAVDGGVLAGFRAAFRDPVIRRLIVVTALSYFAVNTAFVADVFLVRHFGGGSVAYGFLDATFGLGFLLGSLMAGRVLVGREWRWIVYGSMAITLGWATIAVTPWFFLVFVATLIAAGIDSIATVMTYTLVQRRADDGIRARMLSVMDTAGMAANIAGFAVAGAAVASFGGQAVYGLGAVMSLVGVLVLVSYRGNPNLSRDGVDLTLAETDTETDAAKSTSPSGKTAPAVA